MATATAEPAEDLREPAAKLPADQSGRSRKEALDAAFDQVWSEMVPWRPKWLTIGSAMLPNRPRWCIDTDAPSKLPPSYATMMDPVALLAGRTLSSGLSSKLSNPNSKWAGLTTTDPELDAEDDVDRWLTDTMNRIFAVMDRSNFYAATEQVYLDSAYFAVACCDIQPDRKTIIRCTTHPIGGYAIAQDERGRVNHWERQWQSNAFQIHGEFGPDNLTPEVMRALQQRDRLTKFTVRHMIYPNEDADERYETLDKTRMPFRECYWLTSDERADFRPLAEGYYAEWPVPCPRWGPVGNGEVWGNFSPGFIALPDVLMLYAMKLGYLKGLNKQVDPVTVSGNAFRNKKVWSTPGANNVDDQSQGDPQLKAAYIVNLALDHVSAEMQLVRNQINDTFFSRAMTPMLLRLQNETEQPTALQAGLARDESYGMLGPITEGFSDQYHDVAIDRIFGIMWRAGMIDAPPERLRGKPLRVVLKSAMAQAQQSIGVAQLERHLQFAGAVSSMWGALALDGTDPDVLVKKHAQLTGVDRDVLRTDGMRDAIRTQRIAAAQRAAAVQAAPMVGKAAKDMAEARPDADNVLGRMMGAGGAAGVN